MDWLTKHWKVISAIATGLVLGTLWVSAADKGHRSRDQILDRLTEIVDVQQEEQQKRRSKKEYTRELCETGELEPDSEPCKWARQPD